MLPPEYHKHRATAHKRFRYCGPFRLGIAVGESGEFLPPPRTYAAHNHSLYLQGVEEGKRRKASADAAGFVLGEEANG